MKCAKRFVLCLVLCAMALCTTVLAADRITVNTDMSILVEHEIFVPSNTVGQQVMVAEYDGTTYAPLRALAEAYGLTVGYDAEHRIATVDRIDGVVPAMPKPAVAVTFPGSMTIDVNTDMQIMVDGEIFVPRNTKGQEVMVFEYGGTTYAPLRALAEAYDLEVSYDHVRRLASVAQVYDVLRVIDGDTIEIDLHGPKEKVRMIGIDTPESVHPDASKNTDVGIVACEYTKELLDGKKVSIELDVQARDQYGRILAYVYLEGRMVNKTLLEDGYAVMATYPPNVKYVDDFLAIVAAQYAENEQEQQESSTPATPSSGDTGAPAHGMVYVTPTGKRYHYDNSCNGGKYIETSLENALKMGLTPCQKCVE